jgi:hypothetical protein
MTVSRKVTQRIPVGGKAPVSREQRLEEPASAVSEAGSSADVSSELEVSDASTGAAGGPRPNSPRLEALRLEEVLRLLPQRELEAIIEGLKIRVDGGKRIDIPAQVGRALVSLPESRDPASLPAPSRQLLHRLVEAKGVLKVDALPSAVGPLVARGLVFARADEDGQPELLLPIAYMVQLKAWEGEDPRGLRALLTQVSPNVAASIASHYLGSSATHPISIALEAAWRALMDPVELQRAIDALGPPERKLLSAIEELGGEVDTEELLELEREPLRLRGAMGATPSRRGVGFALERRGFLVPIHPNRHVVPSEVAQLIGARAREARDEQRRAIRASVLEEDHAPRRANFTKDPIPLALAMAVSLREKSVEVRPELGTPRSLITRFATRFGQNATSVALIAALSRAVGLWDASARNVNAPPGSLSLSELGQRLFEVWRQGGAWDEARPEGEVLRAAGTAREASVGGVVRSIVLDALKQLAEGRWVPWQAIAAFVATDGRAPGIARLLERWAVRCGVEPAQASLERVAERIAFESLYVLGCVDIGDPDQLERAGGSPMLRITSRGRAYLSGNAPDAQAQSAFVGGHALRLGEEVRVAHALSVAAVAEIGRVDGQFELVITPASVSAAVASGIDGTSIRMRLEAVAPLPEPISRLLVQASAVLGRAEYVATQGFLWVDDPELRELLRTRRQTADLFVDPSPPGGLLLAAGVELDRVVLRCRSLGVEVLSGGEACHTRSVSAARKGPGTQPPESEPRAHSATQRRITATRRRDTTTKRTTRLA